MGRCPSAGRRPFPTSSARVWSSCLSLKFAQSCRDLVVDRGKCLNFGAAQGEPSRARQASTPLRSRSGVCRSDLSLPMVQGGRWGAVLNQGGGHFQPTARLLHRRHLLLTVDRREQPRERGGAVAGLLHRRLRVERGENPQLWAGPRRGCWGRGEPPPRCSGGALGCVGAPPSGSGGALRRVGAAGAVRATGRADGAPPSHRADAARSPRRAAFIAAESLPVNASPLPAGGPRKVLNFGTGRGRPLHLGAA